MTQTNPIKISYTDARLRVLVEEYITQRRCSFTLKDVCSYILYWAIEEGKATQSGDSLIDGETICQEDSERICRFINQIVSEGRLAVQGERFNKLLS